MRIETIAKKLVCAGAITLADRTSSIEEGPAGYADAEGDEGFFFEAAGELLPSIFFVEISEKWSVEDLLRKT